MSDVPPPQMPQTPQAPPNRGPLYAAVGVLTGLIIVAIGLYVTNDDGGGGPEDETPPPTEPGTDGGSGDDGSTDSTGDPGEAAGSADVEYELITGVEEQSVGGNIALLEYGVSSVQAEDGTYSIYYGMLVRNDNDQAAEAVYLTTRFLDEAGNLIEEEVINSNIQRLEPGELGAIGSQLGRAVSGGGYDAPVASIEVEVDDFLMQSTDPQTDRDDALSATVTSVEDTGGSFLEIGYEASSSHAEDVEVTVTALYRNDEGEILGGGSDPFPVIPAGGSTESTINVPFIEDASEDNFELFVTVNPAI